MYPLTDGPAKDLDHLYLTLRPEPLIDPEEFRMFYRGDVNKVRGEDTVGRLALKLQQSYRALPFKAFVMGHSGVGKSTEISRLLERIRDQHVGIRLSIATELNPVSFKVFDVLFLMLIRIAEEAERLKAIPLEGVLTERLVADIRQWAATEQVKRTHTGTAGVGIEAGAGVKEGSLWGGLLGIFASAKAEMKYAAERKSKPSSIGYNGCRTSSACVTGCWMPAIGPFWKRRARNGFWSWKISISLRSLRSSCRISSFSTEPCSRICG